MQYLLCLLGLVRFSTAYLSLFDRSLYGDGFLELNYLRDATLDTESTELNLPCEIILLNYGLLFFVSWSFALYIAELMSEFRFYYLKVGLLVD